MSAHGQLQRDAPAAVQPGRPLRSVLRPVALPLAVAVLLQLVGSLAGLVPLLAVVELARVVLPALDGGLVDGGRAWMVVWVAAGALFVRLAALMVAAYVTHMADLDLALDVRQRLVRQLGRVPLGWFGQRSSGLVRKTVVDDVQALHVLIAHAALDIAAAVVVPVVSVLYLLTVDAVMTLFTVIPVVGAVVAYGLAMRGAMETYAEYERSLSTLSGQAVEFVHGIAVVKAFGQLGRAHSRFRRTAEEFGDFFHGWVRSTSRANLLVELGTSPVTTLVVVLAAGTAMVDAGRLAVVDVLPFLLLGLGLGAPVATLSFGMQKLREAGQAAERLTGVLATPPLPVPPPDQAGSPCSALVEIERATFSYEGTTKALDDITLTLAPGTVTALVGPSGSGKSTLARLLPRFADVGSGAVRVGGVDVRDISPQELYRQVAFVFQDVDLLRTTVRDNIRLARPDADDQTVWAAAQAAQVHERLVALPRGYDSVVGEDAVLSGGEAQRVSVARALLADAPILVLDEATAFADPDSEAAIQDALSRLVAGRSLLVIAHRLHTITGVDQIVVLEAGRVVELGTHPELVARDGRYARMWSAAERARSRPTVAGQLQDFSRGARS